jgi:hypothetical protein
MMRTEGIIPENSRHIARLLDISIASARNLIGKLQELGLLVTNDIGHGLPTLSSPRLSKEYEKSKGHCDELTRVAKLRADKRWGNVDVPIE